jgi:hypothetical protein
MKKIVSVLTILCLSFVMNAQVVSVSDKIGKEGFSVSGVINIFDNDDANKTYYKIEDGKLYTYLVNYYEGRVIQYITNEAVIKKMDLKTIEYKPYRDYGQFMYIKPKKYDKYVTQVNKDLSLEDKITVTTEDKTSSTFMIIIKSQEEGEKLAKLLKKGK